MSVTSAFSDPCPVCGGAFAPRADWFASCVACGFSVSDLPAGPGAGVEGLEELRTRNFAILLDRLAGHRPLPGLSGLEVGTSRGIFLGAARARGIDMCGIEPNRVAGDVARAQGFEIDDALFPEDAYRDRTFDLVVFNDSFEHLPDPGAQIAAAAARVAPGGLLSINLPDSGGVFYRLAAALAAVGVAGPLERLWQRGMASPHVTYFTAGTLARLIERHTALEVIDRFALPSLSRRGLWRRIRSGQGLLTSVVIFPPVWLASFLLSALSPDISVVLARRPLDRA